MSHWNRTDRIEPREGEVVDTIAENGTAQLLKMVRNLWFFEDGSMYVYYVPEFWREIEP